MCKARRGICCAILFLATVTAVFADFSVTVVISPAYTETIEHPEEGYWEDHYGVPHWITTRSAWTETVYHAEQTATLIFPGDSPATVDDPDLQENIKEAIQTLRERELAAAQNQDEIDAINAKYDKINDDVSEGSYAIKDGTNSECGSDPVRLATGDVVMEGAVDAQYRNARQLVAFMRSYLSSRTGSHSLGKGWWFNFDSRVITGVDNEAEARRAEIKMKRDEIAALCSETFFAEITAGLANARAAAEGTLNELNTLISSLNQYGYEELVPLKAAAASKRDAYAAFLGGLSALETETATSMNQLREALAAAEEVLQSADDRVRWAADNKARNRFVVNGTDPAAYEYTGSGTVTVVDEAGTPHVYELVSAPVFNSTARYGDGAVNYYPQGSAARAKRPHDDTLLLLPDGGYRLTKKDGTMYAYSFLGQLTRIEDLNGNSLSFDYDDHQRMRTVRDSLQRTTTIERDGVGRITRIIDPLGRKVTYRFDAAGRLEAVTDPAGGVVGYAYDDDRISAIVNPDGSRRRYEYGNIGGRTVCTKTIDEEGNEELFAYDWGGRSTLYTNNEGKHIKIFYNERNMTVRREFGDGSFIVMEYDEHDNLVRRTDELGRSRLYSYDERRNKVQEVDPVNNVSRWAYNERNQVTEYSDTEGNVTRYEYDDKGNKIALAHPDGSQQNYAYDERGLVVRGTDENGNSRSFAYDRYGYLSSEQNEQTGARKTYENDVCGHVLVSRDELGYETKYTYNPVGKITARRDASGNVESYAYNNRQDLTTKTDCLGNTTTLAYDRRHLLLTVTHPTGDTIEFSYNTDRNKLSETINNKIHTVFSYDDRGRLVRRTQRELGISEQYEYDAVGNMTARIDGAGNRTETRYDALDNPVCTKYPDGTTRTGSYTPTAKLSAVTDELGRTTEYAYDARQRLVSTTDALGSRTTAVYDAKGNVIERTDALGNMTRYAYDEYDRLLKETDAEENSEEFTYDARGCLIAQTDACGNTIHFAYDALGRRVKEIDARGGEKVYHYDAVGNLIASQDGNGNVTHYAYDALGRMMSLIDPYGGKISMTVNEFGLVTRRVDQLGNVSVWEYDELGRLVTTVNALGGRKKYEYDRVGRCTSVTDELGRREQYAYDTRGRLIATANALGETITHQYDEAGNLTARIDARGGAETYAYDELNRRVKETDRLGRVRLSVYDACGNEVARTDSNGQETKNEFDRLNRLTRTTFADGTKSEFSYDGAGNVTRAENDTTRLEFEYNESGLLKMGTDQGIDQTVRYEYDRAGNRTSLSWMDGSRSILHEYGKRNEPVKIIDADHGVTTIAYDAVGREIRRKGPNDMITETAYDAAGRKTQLAHSSGGRGKHTGKIKGFAYLYNAAGERTWQIDEAGKVAAYRYDAAGRLKTVAYPFSSDKKYEDFKELLRLGLFPKSLRGKGGADLEVTCPPGCDAADVRRRIDGCLDEHERLFSAYRTSGKIASGRWRIKPNPDATAFASRLELDREERRKLEEGWERLNPRGRPLHPESQWVWTETFRYDAGGNRTAKANGWGMITYAYDAADAMTGAGERVYEYDMNGNLVREILGNLDARYEYNDENRLIGTHTDHPVMFSRIGASVRNGTAYEYDALGRRSRAAEYRINERGGKTWSAETNRSYLYDGPGFTLLGEFFDTDFEAWEPRSRWRKRHSTPRHNPVSEYVYCNGQPLERTNFDANRTWAGRQGARVADKTGYGLDALGSVVLLTNARGEKTGEYVYDAFGNAYEGAFTRKDRLGFAGQPFDPATRFYNFGYRDYAPAVGRFTTIDPIKDGDNWYAYCGNDPVNRVDILGLQEGDTYTVTMIEGVVYIVYQSKDNPSEKVYERVMIGDKVSTGGGDVSANTNELEMGKMVTGADGNLKVITPSDYQVVGLKTADGSAVELQKGNTYIKIKDNIYIDLRNQGFNSKGKGDGDTGDDFEVDTGGCLFGGPRG